MTPLGTELAATSEDAPLETDPQEVFVEDVVIACAVSVLALIRPSPPDSPEMIALPTLAPSDVTDRLAEATDHATTTELAHALTVSPEVLVTLMDAPSLTDSSAPETVTASATESVSVPTPWPTEMPVNYTTALSGVTDKSALDTELVPLLPVSASALPGGLEITARSELAL